MLAVEWETVGIAGAFVLGAVFGVVVAVRLTRILLEVVLGMRRRVQDED